MVARTLKEARMDAGMSVARLAELSSTSRAAVTDYEAGRKQPQLDTYERLLEALGDEQVILRAHSSKRARIDHSAIAPFENWEPDIARAFHAATADMPVIIDADAAVERLDIRWAQVKVLGEGVSVDGDPVSVLRAQDLWANAKRLLRMLQDGRVPQLRILAREELVSGSDSEMSPPGRALDFLVRATQAGADATLVRHLAGAHLAAHGYPWPWVRHDLHSEYGRAFVACRRTGDGTALVSVLSRSIERVSWNG